MVQSIGGTNPTQFLTQKLSTLHANTNAPAVAPSTQESTVTLSAQNKLNEIGQHYDVSRISNRDVAKLSLELRDSGFLSPFDAANLSIAIAPPGGSVNPDEQRNVLSQFQTQLSLAQNQSSTQSIDSLKNIVDVLQKLHEGRS